MAVPNLEVDERTVIINSLMSMWKSLFRMSGKSLLDYMAHQLRTEGLSVTVEKDYLSVAVNLPYISINVIPDGPGMFELHIEETVGGPYATVTDKHIGPVPDAFVPGVVIGLKTQLEEFSVSLSAITSDPHKAAELGLNAAGRLEGSRLEGKRTRARNLIRSAGPEGMPAEELCSELNVSLQKMRLIVSQLNRAGKRFAIEQGDDEKLMVRDIRKAHGK